MPPVNNHCIIIEYKTNPYKILIPRFLLETAAVTQNGISPTINPLMKMVRKLNHMIPSEKYLMLKIIPQKHNDKLITNTLKK